MSCVEFSKARGTQFAKLEAGEKDVSSNVGCQKKLVCCRNPWALEKCLEVRKCLAFVRCSLTFSDVTFLRSQKISEDFCLVIRADVCMNAFEYLLCSEAVVFTKHSPGHSGLSLCFVRVLGHGLESEKFNPEWPFGCF